MKTRFVRQYLTEFIIIFLSVMLAFLAEDWRDQRQDIEDYELILQEITNNVILDSIEFSHDIIYLEQTIDCIDLLLDQEKTMSADSIQDLLSILLQSRWGDYKKTGYDQLRNSKTLRPNDPLVQEINNYYTYLSYLNESTPSYYLPAINKLYDFLVCENVKPAGFNLNDYDRDLNQQLRINETFRSQLRYLKITKASQLTNWQTQMNNIIYLLRMLKSPEKQYAIKWIGIVGTATGLGWDQDLRMIQVDEHNWETRSIFSDGEIKFRVEGSWFKNWGGNDFPKGTAVKNGSNLKIKEGQYLVRFNDETGVYSFIPIDSLKD